MNLALYRGVTYDRTEGNYLIKLYNDASENEDGTAGAFADIEKAINGAKYFIFIADWSFHPYMRLSYATAPKEENSIGALLIRKACSVDKPFIAIHTWDHTNVGMSDAQNDHGDIIFDILTKRLGISNQPKRPSNLLWRSSSVKGFSWSHHQKFIVFDAPGSDGRREIRAFWGGLDLTKGRFDWPEHPILPFFVPKPKIDPKSDASKTKHFFDKIRGVNPKPEPKQIIVSTEPLQMDYKYLLTDYDDWRNAEFKDKNWLPRQPWHDIHAQIAGPVVWDLVREFVGRWTSTDLGQGFPERGNNKKESTLQALTLFESLFNSKKFIQQWEPHQNGKWCAQVYRSIKKGHWGTKWVVETPQKKGTRKEFRWRLTNDFEMSIQDAYIQTINAAQNFIYIETQYLIGSGYGWAPKRSSVANKIPETLVKRIEACKDKPFHVYIVIPMFPEGDPIGGPGTVQRIFQWSTIAYMIRYLYDAARLRDDWENYLSFYFLANWENKGRLVRNGNRQWRVQSNERYMIYVHSKFMIVDDLYLILGSANLNERSLAGNRDTEIGIGLWPHDEKNIEEKCKKQVQNFRKNLWTEHLRTLPNDWENAGSSSCVKSVHAASLWNYKQMQLGKRTKENGQLCKIPFKATRGGGHYGGIHLDCEDSNVRSGDRYIPDGEREDIWQWCPPDLGVSVGLLSGPSVKLME